MEQGEFPADHGRSFWPATGDRTAEGPAGAGAADGPYFLPATDDPFWAQMTSWMREGRLFEATAIGSNRGGLLVRVGDRLAFLPASQMAELPCSIGGPALRDDLEAMVGRTFRLRVIEVDPRRDRVICSERASGWTDREIDARLEELETRVGQCVEGRVRSLCDFGVFVDLDHVDGLIHISEISWQRVEHPSDALAVGQDLRLKVLHVDRAARRVALSLRQMQPDPWQDVADRYSVGDIVDATITNVVDFGAFALLCEGVEGLLHISELSDAPLASPHDVVREGQRVRARVLSIEPAAHRLGLSLRQV
jgi:small subunit ribosomal protein S1